jgi:hypothetical protein
MTQGARGESIIQGDDAEYRILFTNRALAEAESTCGKSVIAIAQGFTIGATGIGDVAQMLAVGLEAARKDARLNTRAYTVGDAYRIMDEVGFTVATRAVMESVAAVLRFRSEPVEGQDPTSE